MVHQCIHTLSAPLCVSTCFFRFYETYHGNTLSSSYFLTMCTLSSHTSTSAHQPTHIHAVCPKHFQTHFQIVSVAISTASVMLVTYANQTIQFAANTVLYGVHWQGFFFFFLDVKVCSMHQYIFQTVVCYIYTFRTLFTFLN